MVFGGGQRNRLRAGYPRNQTARKTARAINYEGLVPQVYFVNLRVLRG